MRQMKMNLNFNLKLIKEIIIFTITTRLITSLLLNLIQIGFLLVAQLQSVCILIGFREIEEKCMICIKQWRVSTHVIKHQTQSLDGKVQIQPPELIFKSGIRTLSMLVLRANVHQKVEFSESICFKMEEDATHTLF